MKFQVDVNDINYGLNMVTRALSARPVKPAYECVMMETSPEGLKLTCTDGEMTIKTLVPSSVSEEGEILLPAKLFNELMHKQSGGMANIEIDGNGRAVIRVGGSKANMVGMSTEEFPVITDITAGTRMKVNSGKLKQAISHVLFAVSNDESHKVLTGVLVEEHPDEVVLVGLDGFRLALQRVSAPNELPAGQEKVSVIIPGRVMSELSKMLPDDEEKEVSLIFNSTHIMIGFEGVKLFSSLLTGEFIDYNHVLPKNSEMELKVEKRPLTEALERCGLMAREGRNNLITLEIKEDVILLSSRAERGDVHEEVPMVLSRGTALRISFNSHYLIDVIRNVEDDQFVMSFQTNISPCLVTPVEGNQYSYLVLPVRTFDN